MRSAPAQKAVGEDDSKIRHRSGSVEEGWTRVEVEEMTEELLSASSSSPSPSSSSSDCEFDGCACSCRASAADGVNLNESGEKGVVEVAVVEGPEMEPARDAGTESGGVGGSDDSWVSTS